MKDSGAGTDQFREDVIQLMVPIAGGTVKLRDFKNMNQWFSSNYTLADPGREKDRQIITRTAKIDPFYVMKYPVTKGLYRHVMYDKGVASAKTNLPMTEVSWIDAIIFCNRLSTMLGRTACYIIHSESEHTVFNEQANGFRLLTDAEWQYTCQAGTQGYRYGAIAEIAWYKDNSNGSIQPVGKLRPNPWGIYDMIGNVWEWCWDLYDVDRYGNYRVFRGGSWAEVANTCGSTTRRKSAPTFKIDDLGFRIALSATGQSRYHLSDRRLPLQGT